MGAWKLCAIPVSEIDFGEPSDEDEDEDEHSISCTRCGTVLTDEAYHTGDFVEFYCAACIQEYCRPIEEEARTYATRECRITKPFPRYDHDTPEYRPTPDEYAAGDRVAHTPNAFVTRLRHEYTNYETIIDGADRTDLRDQIFYAAVRQRIDELVSAELIENGDGSVLSNRDV